MSVTIDAALNVKYPNNAGGILRSRLRMTLDELEFVPVEMLPPGILSVRCAPKDHPTDDDKRIFGIDQIIFQRPPHRRTVKISEAPKGGVTAGNSRYFDLLLPWTIYEYCGGGSINVLMMPGPIIDAKQKYPGFFPVPLPNMYASGHVCISTEVAEQLYENVGLESTIEKVYSGVWNAGFNMDAAEVLSQFEDEIPRKRHTGGWDIFKFYEEWESLTSLKEVNDRYLKEPAYGNLSLDDLFLRRDILNNLRTIFT